jgi:pantothenate kinase
MLRVHEFNLRNCIYISIKLALILLKIMGNIVVIDMGHTIMRVAIVDRNNKLQKSIYKYGINKEWALLGQSFPYEESNGLNLEMTIDLPDNGGKIFFLRYNVFEKSIPLSNYKVICRYLKKELKNKENEQNLKSPLKQNKQEVNEFPYTTKFPNITEFKTDFLKQLADCLNISKDDYYLNSTGGYNDYYLKDISEIFNVYIKKNHYYVESIINAIDFLNRFTKDCFFKSEKTANGHKLLTEVEGTPTKYHLKPSYFSMDNIYPYLLVLMRSGTTIHLVEAFNKSQKIGSSVIGGATFMGLIRMLTKYTDPEFATSEATNGNNMEIDLSVGDIYGGAIESLGLNQGIIASSFAKASKISDDKIAQLRDKDVTRSLLSMIIINVLQIASLYAQLEGLERIIVVGTKFMRIELAESMEVWN